MDHHGYILEAQEFFHGKVENMPAGQNSKWTHKGYMNKVFGTKEHACEYYNLHNRHLRSLNAHGTWASDWDPVTKLRYIVRRYHGESTTVAPFS